MVKSKSFTQKFTKLYGEIIELDVKIIAFYSKIINLYGSKEL